MKKTFIALIFIAIVLAACSNSDKKETKKSPVPEELIADANSDPIEIKDQFGLQIGETGFIVDVKNRNILEITLNSVSLRDELNGQKENYVLGNFTIKNHGEVDIPRQGVEYPVLVDGSKADALKNGEITKRQDLLGMGSKISQFDGSMNEGDTIPTGKEKTGDILMIADEKTDQYIIYFGYEYYLNKVSWEFNAQDAE
ncbi:hypothetical protein DX933_11880 [Ornithinibacillus gellani]|uniref:hypothetical protein n=1 Tax=Ornithinibacillus gellani TaxID=2293253 RepID=UPI000F467921|nr:hypothetical protein [Ornithinibacillus gellani]TQS74628.1 hypothetical protein DX933_11880 [Ornithinibacillus gellani]